MLALGGGTGHLLRAIAFARAAVARRHRVRILASSPFTSTIASVLAPPDVEVANALCSADASADGSAETMRAVARAWLAAEDDDALVVDTFPRGLVGELDGTSTSRPRVLVHRDLADAYALQQATREAAAAFDAIVAPGESGPLAPTLPTRPTAPWIIAASTPILDRAAARAAWGIAADDTRPLVVVVTTSDDDDARKLVALARSLACSLRDVHVVEATLATGRASGAATSRAPLPLASRLAGVDLLVGSGGYHLVHEARATATPLLALPAPRTYDVQARRVATHERASDLDDVARRIRAATPRTTTPPPSIEDGAAAGVRIVEELISRG